MIYQLLALCPEELKETVSRELEGLGAFEIEEAFKAVYFKVSEEDYYNVHLKLRTVSSLIRVIKKHGKVSVKGTFNLSKKIDWSEVFTSHRSYRIDANITERGPDFPSSNEFSKQVRLGIEAHFEKKGLKIPRVSLTEPQVMITSFLC